MFDALTPAQPDAIIKLMQQFRDDPRPDKVDLGVGVYRDARGSTPVMRAVKTAEARLVAQQDTKAYVALAGDAGFHAAMAQLVLGAAVAMDHLACAATPGGTGAVRQALELVRMARPGATVWVSDPTWPNHTGLIDAVGLRAARYRYYDAAGGGVDFDGMLASLAQIGPGDVVLLHACCHNPTGADLSVRQWAALADHLAARGALPLVDMAYQGFGAGLDADAAGLRHLVARLPEVLLAVSGAKTFGLYRERVGLVMAYGPPAQREVTAGALAWLNRQNFAFPPDHGARVVTTILTDADLRVDWQAELEGMRLRLQDNRAALANALETAGLPAFAAIAQQTGMFSLLPLSPAQIEALRAGHGVYLIGDGRINVAGINDATLPRVVAAIAQVL